MPKTLPPGTVRIPSQPDALVLNVLPDPFDARDLEYRPRLQPLPPALDQRADRHVLLQQGNSCVGHALAAMINTVLRARVSPYMLYYLARRYDEFTGEDDSGSSLRGGLKGWFHHGVALEPDWPKLRTRKVADLDDSDFIAKCRPRPLGAFYRVNAFRLDDMQSAITELNAIVGSAVIHNGWIVPQKMKRAGKILHVIAKPVNAKALGGHAFALVGYNEVGFLVQNSWGSDWAGGGFATLPYEDWLDSAYDAWVARPGVPNTPFALGKTRTAIATGGELATAAGPDLRRLQVHVVNLGNDGHLSMQGRFTSSPAQIDGIFAHMQRTHEHWRAAAGVEQRHVVLYAHGGLVSERSGLETAQKHLNWWLNNRVYPITFAWQSGPSEVLVNQMADAFRERLPAGGIGFDLAEQFDRMVERVAHANFRWMWNELKENARASAAAVRGNVMNAAARRPDRVPGATLLAHRLAQYIARHGRDTVRVHLVGHSSGSIFHAALLQRLVELDIEVQTVAFLAPALRVDEFRRDVLPHLGRHVHSFANFVLSDQRELDDVVGIRDTNVYQKSLLYLVSRALERPRNGHGFEIPLLGMAKFLDDGPAPVVRAQIESSGGTVVVAPSTSPATGRSDAVAHGDFDDDVPTMTSVVLRMLGLDTQELENTYQAHAPLRPIGPPVSAAVSASRAPAGSEDSLLQPADAGSPGDAPLMTTAAPQEESPTPPPQASELPFELGVAPRSGSSVIDLLLADGWAVDDEAADS
jgi:hypothetical protein